MLLKHPLQQCNFDDNYFRYYRRNNYHRLPIYQHNINAALNILKPLCFGIIFRTNQI